MKRFFSIVLLAVFLIPQVVSAEENRDYYLSATGGLLFTNDADIPDQENQNGEDTSFKLHNDVFDSEGTFNTGGSGTIAIGKSWNRFFRTEFEYGYRKASFNTVKGTLESYQLQDYVGGMTEQEMNETDRGNAFLQQEGGVITPFEESTSGDMSAHSLMVNAFLDFSNKSKVTPYIGAGVGLAIWQYNYVIEGFDGQTVESNFGLFSEGDNNGPHIRSDQQLVGDISCGHKGVDFAYQMMAGVAYDFTENITATAGYRLFGINNDPGFISHSSEFGIRYSF